MSRDDASCARTAEAGAIPGRHCGELLGERCKEGRLLLHGRQQLAQKACGAVCGVRPPERREQLHALTHAPPAALGRLRRLGESVVPRSDARLALGAGTSPLTDGGVRPELGRSSTGSGAEPQKKILPLKRFLGLKTRTQRT